MDDDDLIKVDEINDDNQNEKFSALDIEEILDNTEHTKKRRLICISLQSAEISKYIKQTPAQFEDSCHIEVVAHELFSNLFSQKFNQKKLNFKQKKQLNHALFTESIWKIDRSSMY